ncbi:transcription-repair coupling factor [Ignavibacteria bacterium]|nr:transcription-repair coupling factor [Bacteroidota bacterium]MCZ2133545.1 transcription-repair coupling factor [Bacteroidota bacterium]
MIKKTIKDFLAKFSGLPFLTDIANRLDGGQSSSIKFLHGSARSAAVAALWHKKPRRILLLTENRDEAKEWLYDLEAIIGGEKLALFAEPEHRAIYDQLDPRVAGIIDALATVERYDDAIAVATPEAFGFALPAPDNVSGSRINIKRGMNIPLKEFIHSLTRGGFVRKDFVETYGDMAARGGIVDIFPLGRDNPIRIEFWGDEAESVREFDPLSQRSIRELDSVDILGSVFVDERKFDSSLRDYFPDDSLIIFNAPEALEVSFFTAGIEFPEYLKDYTTLSINALGTSDVLVRCRPQPDFNGSIAVLCTSLAEQISLKISTWLSAEGQPSSRRLQELIINFLEQDEVNAASDIITRKTILLDRSLSKGFILPDAGIAIFNEHEIFGRKHFQTSKKGKTFTGITLRELSQLKRGDFVVHADKGIGRFDGLETINVAGSGVQECARIVYAGGDTLFVHLNTLHKLQKYSAAGDEPPKLSRLGSSEWERKKDRAKRKLKDIARDLIKLYAARKRSSGFRFAADTVWQKEFEAAFIYEDTPDQAKTTSEVKLDMESTVPMDRLVCGDVGFGKTEVAIRAAFKAVQNGKQVAVLVPTTILAQQHFHTFTDRLRRYPVNVEALSRLRPPAEQTKILQKVKSGTVDILIGTHRILSKDVVFKDLGLVVIDEEHRFGVGAKEKLRQLRISVDTLMLTATPIPRTLNFSLMGARDLSVIETPPRNRLPVETEITEWNEGKIIEGIHREIERGGQIFFVNDTVGGIPRWHERLLDLYPSLRCGIAHGQMDGHALESVMDKFLERKYDLLLTTKIAESGLDIPNANTIFINNAQNFGLAELYQLRGRVGRSNMQAYCALITPPIRSLSRSSVRRLQALEECTDLGSGFQLALRDMEIRGAGNLLGAEQSGFIVEMGFDLYQKILDEAVRELREQEFADVFDADSAKPVYANEDIAIDIDGDALLPNSYVASDTDRFEFYKKLYNIRSEEGTLAIASELRDRYGTLPEQAENLILGARLRAVAVALGFVRVSIKNELLRIELPPETDTFFYANYFAPIAAHTASMRNAKFTAVKKKTFIEIPCETPRQALDALREYRRAANIRD